MNAKAAILMHSEEGAICRPFIFKIPPIEKNSLTQLLNRLKERPLTTTLKMLGMQRVVFKATFMSRS